MSFPQPAQQQQPVVMMPAPQSGTQPTGITTFGEYLGALKRPGLTTQMLNCGQQDWKAHFQRWNALWVFVNLSMLLLSYTTYIVLFIRAADYVNSQNSWIQINVGENLALAAVRYVIFMIFAVFLGYFGWFFAMKDTSYGPARYLIMAFLYVLTLLQYIVPITYGQFEFRWVFVLPSAVCSLYLAFACCKLYKEAENAKCQLGNTHFL